MHARSFLLYSSRMQSAISSRPKRIRTLGKLLLPLLVLTIAGLATARLMASGTEPPRSPTEERFWSVSVEPVRREEAQPQLRLYGRLVAGRTAELRALVAGEVVETSENLREGGILLRGEELLRIDNFYYQSALLEARANLEEARARLQEHEIALVQEQSALGREIEQLELNRIDQERAEDLASRGTVSQKTVDDKRMITLGKELSVQNRRNNVQIQEARIAQQQAVIKRLESGVGRAERNLENTVLSAPFDGLVEVVGVAVGRLVSVNDRVANLIDLNNLEARFTLSNAQYGRIIATEGSLAGRDLKVIWKAGREALVYSGVVSRAAPRIETGSGGVDIYVRLQIENVDTPLRPGAFLEADFPDVTYPNVVRLPQTALYEGDIVYVVDDERLTSRTVEVVGRDGAFMLLRGDIGDGEAVLTSRLPQAGEGVRVQVVSP